MEPHELAQRYAEALSNVDASTVTQKSNHWVEYTAHALRPPPHISRADGYRYALTTTCCLDEQGLDGILPGPCDGWGCQKAGTSA